MLEWALIPQLQGFLKIAIKEKVGSLNGLQIQGEDVTFSKNPFRR